MCFVVIVAFTMPAQADLMTIVHGLPALPGALPSNNPVDIAVDYVCEYFYQPYGTKLGPKRYEAGKHTFIFYEAIPDKPCQGFVLAAKEIELGADDEIDVVLHLNAEDEVVIGTWDNTTALDAIDKGATAAIEVRNAASSPTLTAVLKKSDDEIEGDVDNGSSFGPVKTTTGEHILQVRNESEILDQDTGEVQLERAYWVYLTGSVDKKTVNILTLESVPDEAIDGGDVDDTPSKHRKKWRQKYSKAKPDKYHKKRAYSSEP